MHTLQRSRRAATFGNKCSESAAAARARGKLFRSELPKQLPRAGRRLDSGHARQDRRLQGFRDFLSFDLWVAIENHVAQIGEQLRGAVAAARNPKEFGRIVEKGGGD